LNKDGMTVVLVTHERTLADRYASRQVFLSDGKVVAPEQVEAVAR
jgi:ABC-type polar amino acid transport system ATPase subunit